MEKSESIQNLAKALVAFQMEVKNPANTANNPFFKSKYAPLPDILNDVRPLLAKHGLAVLQSPSGDGDKIVITTMLIHESGEYIETCPLVLKTEKATAQGAGSAITYARRYALSAVLGISSEDDDDGNNASNNNDKGKSPQTDKKGANSGGNSKGNSNTGMKLFYATMADIAKAEGVDKKIAEDYGKKIIYHWCSVNSLTKLTEENWQQIAGASEKLEEQTVKGIRQAKEQNKAAAQG